VPLDDGVVVLNADDVRVEQLELLDQGGMSAWGALIVDPVAVARKAGVESGFVSVRTAKGWVVHNLPVQSHPEMEWPEIVKRQGLPAPRVVHPVRAHFDVGTTRALASTSMAVVFTRQPLGSAKVLKQAEGVPLGKFKVVTTPVTLPGGVAAPPPDGIPPQPPPPPPILAPEPIEPVLGVQGWQSVTLPNDDNVNSAFNQCVPVAIANGLAYLRGTFGLAVPEPHVPGVGGGESLVGTLDALSARVTAGPCSGSPVFDCFDGNGQNGFINGLYGYLDTRGLENSVTLRHQGIDQDYPSACGFGGDGPVSTSDGPEVTVDWVKERVDAGNAVLLAFDRLQQTPQGEVKTSGHMIRIYGYSVIQGQTYFMELDDQQQDAMNNGMCQPDPDGLSWESFAVGDVDNDGRLNKSLAKLMEVSFAIAIGPG
jgi:hypothetical protein